jgi:hypothetical protein
LWSFDLQALKQIQARRGWRPFSQRDDPAADPLTDPLTVPPRKRSPEAVALEPAVLVPEEQVLEKISGMQREGLFRRPGKE